MSNKNEIKFLKRKANWSLKTVDVYLDFWYGENSLRFSLRCQCKSCAMHWFSSCPTCRTFYSTSTICWHCCLFRIRIMVLFHDESFQIYYLAIEMVKRLRAAYKKMSSRNVAQNFVIELWNKAILFDEQKTRRFTYSRTKQNMKLATAKRCRNESICMSCS